MISFDVVSLFTNVPLKQTIDIILRKVYDEKLISTKIKCGNMRELLLLCTQGVTFTFDNETYTRVDRVMMGSPLGALFANIYMCELEDTIIPKLEDKICSWIRYVQVSGPLNAGQISKLSLDPKIHLAIVILVIIPCNQCNLAFPAHFLKIPEKGWPAGKFPISPKK